MKKILYCLTASLIGLSAIGCNKGSRTVVEAAPITTVSIVFVDSFTEQDRQELIDSVTLTFQSLLEDYPTTVDNSTTINYDVNIVNNEVNITIKDNKFLTWNGNDNECPSLYEAFCRKRFGDNHPDRDKWKNRCKQIQDDCKKRRNR